MSVPVFALLVGIISLMMAGTAIGTAGSAVAIVVTFILNWVFNREKVLSASKRRFGRAIAGGGLVFAIVALIISVA